MTYFTIKQVSQRTKLSVHTIRHYCDWNLIPSLVRDANNNRLFDEESINWLYAIKYLRQSGMSLKEIQSFFANDKTYNPLNDLDRVHLMKEAIKKADANLVRMIKEHKSLKIS